MSWACTRRRAAILSPSSSMPDHRRPDPLALKGAVPSGRGFGGVVRNLLIYGIGGIIVPFIGIKLIDMAITPSVLREDFDMLKESVLLSS